MADEADPAASGTQRPGAASSAPTAAVANDSWYSWGSSWISSAVAVIAPDPDPQPAEPVPEPAATAGTAAGTGAQSGESPAPSTTSNGGEQGPEGGNIGGSSSTSSGGAPSEAPAVFAFESNFLTALENGIAALGAGAGFVSQQVMATVDSSLGDAEGLTKSLESALDGGLAVLESVGKTAMTVLTEKVGPEDKPSYRPRTFVKGNLDDETFQLILAETQRRKASEQAAAAAAAAAAGNSVSNSNSSSSSSSSSSNNNNGSSGSGSGDLSMRSGGGGAPQEVGGRTGGGEAGEPTTGDTVDKGKLEKNGDDAAASGSEQGGEKAAKLSDAPTAATATATADHHAEKEKKNKKEEDEKQQQHQKQEEEEEEEEQPERGALVEGDGEEESQGGESASASASVSFSDVLEGSGGKALYNALSDLHLECLNKSATGYKNLSKKQKKAFDEVMEAIDSLFFFDEDLASKVPPPLGGGDGLYEPTTAVQPLVDLAATTLASLKDRTAAQAAALDGKAPARIEASALAFTLRLRKECVEAVVAYCRCVLEILMTIATGLVAKTIVCTSGDGNKNNGAKILAKGLRELILWISSELSSISSVHCNTMDSFLDAAIAAVHKSGQSAPAVVETLTQAKSQHITDTYLEVSGGLDLVFESVQQFDALFRCYLLP